MNKTMFLSLIAGTLLFTAAACGGEDEPQSNDSSITPSTTTVVLDGEGGSMAVDVKSTHEWSATPSESWIKVTPNASVSKDATLTISADVNSTGSERTGSVVLAAGSARNTIAVSQPASAKENPYACPLGDDYVMVFQDEFDKGKSLDRTYWRHEVQNSGWVNNELQNYVDEHIDGNLVTELRDGKLQIHCFKYKGKIYSGRVYANEKTGYKYGYFEASIKLPKGKGTWPAFWMMPSNNNFSTNPWPNCGEIDIMEEVGADPNVVSSSIHCYAYNHPKNTQKTASRNIRTAESEFHVYGCEWTPDYLRFYVDGVELMTFKNEQKGKDTWPFTYEFYPILNLAWGGNWGGYKGVDESALPCTMEVEYLRIYQKK